MTSRTFRACHALRIARLLALWAACNLAQATPALREVVVTATRLETPITDVIADVTTIDRETLERAGQTSLRELLGQQPGVQWSSNGSYRSSTGVFLRGASASQTIVLVDGVRIGSATSGTPALENLPLERIDHIEILRGAAAALYGPDAVGGVIQIFTRRVPQALQASASLGAGSDGQSQAAASLGATAGIFAYSLGLSQEKASGISTSNNPAASGFNADADGFDSRSWDAKLVAQFSAAQSLTLSTLQSRTQYQFDGTPSPNPLGLVKGNSDAWTKPVQDNTALQWDAQWTPDWHARLLAATAHEDSVTEYYRMGDNALGGASRFNTQREQLSWQHSLRLGPDTLTALLEARSEAVDSSTRYLVSQRNMSARMLSYAWQRPDWSALAVLREDTNSQFGSLQNWALSGGYRVAPGLRTIASLGTSDQAPTFNQLYYPGFGSPGLVPQRNRATELGLKYAGEDLAWSAIAYDNQIQGFIDPVSNLQSAKAVLQGATLSLQAEQGERAYTLSYDYADPRAYAATPALDNLRLVRVAQHMLKGRITQRLQALQLIAELALASEREDARVVGSGRETLPSYATLNLAVEWALRPGAKLLARLNNASDTSYMLANGYSMPGRNLFVSMVWSQ